MQIGPPPGAAYGATALPAELAWNPAKYGAVAAAATATQPNPGAIPKDTRGHMQAIAPMLVVVAALWLLAERHASIKAGGGGSLKGAVNL